MCYDDTYIFLEHRSIGGTESGEGRGGEGRGEGVGIRSLAHSM